MDVFTHFLLPYAAAIVLFGLHRAKASGLSIEEEAVWERRAALAAVFGFAGFAPDLDGFMSGLKHLPGLYFIQHRGLSHTLIGAPLYALAATGLLALAARRWPERLGIFRWRNGFIPAAILGSWTHLVLDGLTYSGVPLLWPFAAGRVTLHLFHWIIDWFFPIGLVVIALHLFRRFDRIAVARAGVALVLAMVILAGARFGNMPDPEEPGALVFPRDDPKEWTVLVPVDGGWEGRLWRDGRYAGIMTFHDDRQPGSEEAIETARSSDAYKGFLMGSFGPVIIQSHQEGDRWTVIFIDVAQRFEAATGPEWTPTQESWSRAGTQDWGYLELSVSNPEVSVRAWGW
ncbi:MAG: metal-dependent hydrolase [Euryarchaeota archaeon]|nr:metal-dependent hydrolase [Euryarchaeota archaeon]